MKSLNYMFFPLLLTILLPIVFDAAYLYESFVWTNQQRVQASAKLFNWSMLVNFGEVIVGVFAAIAVFGTWYNGWPIY